MTNSLWGALDDLPNIKTPRLILTEQAELLKKFSKGLLYGEVDANVFNSHEGQVTQLTLDVRVPSLNNYRIMLLSCNFEKTFFPATLTNEIVDESFSANTVEEFEENLAKILQSQAIKIIISGLLSETRSTSLFSKDDDDELPF